MKEQFKIRHKQTGLFSTGGENPKWTKEGKTWSGIGPLRLHLKQFNRKKTTFLSDWEVVRYLEPRVSKPVPALDLYENGTKWPENTDEEFFGWVWIDPYSGGCFAYPHETHPDNAVKVYR